MDNINNNKKTIFICLILIIISVFIYFIVQSKDSIFGEEYTKEEYIEIKSYEANRYIPVYMTEEEMVSKYLNDFKNLMLFNIEESYNVLNKEYREKKFSSLDNFKEYINNIVSTSTYSMEVDKYSVSTIDGLKYFNIFDKSGYQYIIKENSINDYEVFLDAYTIKID